MIQDLSTAEQTSQKDIDKSNLKSGFQTVTFSRLGVHHALLSDPFRTSQVKQLFLHLYPTCLVVSSNAVPEPEAKVRVLSFTFNTAFYVTVKKINEVKNYSVLKILSHLEQKPESFYSEDASVVGKWRAVLSNYVNQIGIQEYYKTIKHLGKGVSADVYLTERISDKKQFAIKVFAKSKNSEKCLNGFISELKIMRVMNHPNIIKLYEVFVSNQFIYAVLEYLPGGNLFEELKAARRFTKEEQYTVIKHLSQGVEHLRLKRIAHRDLKLENILIRKVGDKKEYVICDFGLATWIDQESYIFEKCGTPGYIAPEILRLPKEEKLLLTSKVDIYSLGAIFHLIMLSRPTFIYETGEVKMAIKLNKQAIIDWTQSIYNYLTDDELRMLQLMLEPNPDKRISSEGLLKLEYFRKDRQKGEKGEKVVTATASQKIETPKTENLSTMLMGSSKFLKNTEKGSTSKVKEERQTSLNRNSSLTKEIKFERKVSEAEKQKQKQKEKEKERDKSNSKSSIFDIFRRKKGSNANSTDILSPHKQQVKSLVSMSMNTTEIPKSTSTERKSTFGFLFKRNQN